MADRRPISATTTVAAVIGSPIAHSRSPRLINAAFAAADLDWTYVAFDVAPGRGGEAVAAMRTLGLGGMSVTMPHKADVMAALDAVSGDAQALGAVNCIAREDDRLVGHNTDGNGLLSSLSTDQGLDVSGANCVVLGAGGAARSVARALGVAGAGAVTVVNRTADKAEVAARLAGPSGRVGDPSAIASADLLVNATSVGMGSAPGDPGPLPIDASLLHPGLVVVDLVYTPLETPLLAAAAAAGATPIDGIGMLVHQAALAVRLWTGAEPSIDAMSRAARSS